MAEIKTQTITRVLLTKGNTVKFKEPTNKTKIMRTWWTPSKDNKYGCVIDLFYWNKSIPLN